MSVNSNLVDVIETAQDHQPMCECGRHTVPVWHDGSVWLECQLLSEPARGALRRALTVISAPLHVRERIIDLPADDATELATV